MVALVPPHTMVLALESAMKSWTIRTSSSGLRAGPVIRCTGLLSMMRIQATVVSSPGLNWYSSSHALLMEAARRMADTVSGYWRTA